MSILTPFRSAAPLLAALPVKSLVDRRPLPVPFPAEGEERASAAFGVGAVDGGLDVALASLVESSLTTAVNVDAVGSTSMASVTFCTDVMGLEGTGDGDVGCAWSVKGAVDCAGEDCSGVCEAVTEGEWMAEGEAADDCAVGFIRLAIDGEAETRTCGVVVEVGADGARPMASIIAARTGSYR